MRGKKAKRNDIFEGKIRLFYHFIAQKRQENH